MNYTPITITQDNLDWAVRENILTAIAALRTKVKQVDPGPVGEIDADGFQVRLVGTSDLDHAACTAEKLTELLGQV